MADDAEREAFLRMQFQCQHDHYQVHFEKAQFDLIIWDGNRVGRLYVDRADDEIRIIDIALLPEYRGRGIGRGLITLLIEEAEKANKPVRLRVEPDNPALRLYEQLGFQMIADEQVNWHMQWTPKS